MKDSTAFAGYFIGQRNWCKPGVWRRSRGHRVNRGYRLLPQLVCRPLRPRGRAASTGVRAGTEIHGSSPLKLIVMLGPVGRG